MPKLDLKRELKHLYAPKPGICSIVEVPPQQFLMIDGQGDPNESEPFQGACDALYGTAYTIKFAMKAAGQDHTVMPLEGLWWAEDATAFTEGRKDEWQWTLMILQPDFVTADHVAAARAQVEAKRNPPLLAELRFERFEEGLAAQTLHVGPYAEEGPTVTRLHQFIADEGRQLRGKHHEIYLGDPRRTAPGKLKTVIRQPVR
ncbi:GyrI-like domain-containing protein [bacterium]|nr:GyrI-like domain-containing protein [bacterium]